jgi:hypothetical protein
MPGLSCKLAIFEKPPVPPPKTGLLLKYPAYPPWPAAPAPINSTVLIGLQSNGTVAKYVPVAESARLTTYPLAKSRLSEADAVTSWLYKLRTHTRAAPRQDHLTSFMLHQAELLARFDVTTPGRWAMFIAQVAKEEGGAAGGAEVILHHAGRGHSHCAGVAHRALSLCGCGGFIYSARSERCLTQ